MADPVLLWSQPFTVNAGNTAGIQSLSAPVALADGTFLIAWVDDTNNVDGEVGTDIIAQHYDALGNPIGGAFQLNHFGMLANETDPTIAALASGGFVVAYEQNANTGDTDILYEVYDADLNRVDEGAVAFGAAGADQVRNPVALVYPFTDDFTFVFERTSLGDTDIRAITPEGGLPEFDAGQNSADFDRRPDAAAFVGGEFVTVYEEDDAGVTGIEFEIRNASSAFVDLGAVAANGEDPHVAVIGDTQFVTTWNDPAGGIFAEIRDRDGVLIRNNFTIANNAGDNEHSSDVTALNDGGFFVVWYDSVDDRIEGRRFDAAGNSVGSQITIANGSGLVRPELATLADGRVLVSFEDGGDIRAAIVDPRDYPILGDGLDNVLTGRPSGSGSIVGFSGDDQLYGGAGDELLLGGNGADRLDGGGGIDIASYVNSGQAVYINLAANTASGGEAEGDTLSNIETIYGSAFNDSLTGSGLADNLQGLNGNDFIQGGAGADSLDGGDGTGDSLYYSTSAAGVTVNLTNGTASGGDADGDIFTGFENLIGSANADALTGDAGANTIQGGAGDDNLRGLDGDDRLSGGGGDDRLTGGVGIDTLSGGGGGDTFVLHKSTTNRDIIISFSVADDTLEISAASFGAGLVAGPLSADQFVSNATGLAEDAEDRFILNTVTGELFFDTNGNANGGHRLIATFTDGIPALTAADFDIV